MRTKVAACVLGISATLPATTPAVGDVAPTTAPRGRKCALHSVTDVAGDPPVVL